MSTRIRRAVIGGGLFVASLGACTTLPAEVQAPTVSSIDVSSGPPGTVVRLTGTHLDTVTAADLLTPAVDSCSFSAVDATHVDVTIPTGPNNGPFKIRVTGPGGTADSPPFTVENFTTIISGSEGARALTSGERADLVSSGNQMFELGCNVDRSDNQLDSNGGSGADLLGGTTGGSLTTLFSADGLTLYDYAAERGGLLGTQQATGLVRQNRYVTFETWYASPAGYGGGIRVRINGCELPSRTLLYSASGSISAYSAAWLFTRDGSTHPMTGLTLKRLRRRTNDPRKTWAEGLILGDSNTSENAIAPAGTAAQQAAVGTLLYTEAEAQARAGIIQLAYPGDQISDQKTKYLASTIHTEAGAGARIAWAYWQIGVNDITAGSSAATIIAALEDLRDTVLADCPNAVILMGTIVPVDGYLFAANPLYVGRRADVNTAILSTIANIVPVDNEASLEDSGNPGHLDSAYEAGTGGNEDHLHLNLAGRQVVADNLRAALEGVELL